MAVIYSLIYWLVFNYRFLKSRYAAVEMRGFPKYLNI
ncbi:MAG: hypothetical protein ACI8SC_000510, partial [Colwellia sp.]